MAAAAAVAVEAATVQCSMNGQPGNSACVCDPGWTGDTCNLLAVRRSRVLWPQLSEGDPRFHHGASQSWDGSMQHDIETGQWHGWFNTGCQGALTNSSLVHTYRTGAVHAIADQAGGPYRFVDVAIPGETECPMSVSDGAGGVVIAFADHTWPNGSALNLPMQCQGASNGRSAGAAARPTGTFPLPTYSTLQAENHPCPADPSIEGRRMGVASAPSPAGPWTITYPKIEKPDYQPSDGDMVCGINPSLHQLPNGT